MKEAASAVTVVRLEITQLDNQNLPQKNKVFKLHASSSPVEALLSQQSELETT